MPEETQVAPTPKTDLGQLDGSKLPQLQTPKPPTSLQAPAVAMRRFGDQKAARESVFKNALTAVQKLKPAENTRYRLEMSNFGYVGKDDLTPADEKHAMLTDQTLSKRLTGDVRLIDKATGNVVDTKRTTVAHVPYLTDRGMFIIDGNQSVLSSQSRLDPGIYTRRKESGQYSNHNNFKLGQGVSHTVELDPESGVFKINIGQAEIPGAALLKAMGVTEKEMEAAWGPELTAVNLKAARPHHLDRLWEKFGPRNVVPEDKAKALTDIVSQFKLDPWTTQRTLGKPYETYTKDAAFDAMTKLLRTARGEIPPDDRDSMVFSSVYGPEHLIEDRLERAQGYLNKVLWDATNKGSLRGVQPGLLNQAIRSLFLGSGLAIGPEGTHMTETVDHLSRITKAGEAGLGRSADAFPRSSRDVNPTQLGFIDAVKSSESACHAKGTFIMTFDGWKSIEQVTYCDKIACVVDGRISFCTPDKVHCYDYKGTMYGVKNGAVEYLVTPNHRMFVRPAKLATKPFYWTTAENIHNKFVSHKISGWLPWEGDHNDSLFYLPNVNAQVPDANTINSTSLSSRRFVGNHSIKEYGPFDYADFSELMGWYLSEGNTTKRQERSRNSYDIRISQSKTKNPENCRLISQLLLKLGFKDKYYNTYFILYGKQIVSYFDQFGYAEDKFIPCKFLSGSVASRLRMRESLLRGDGTTNRYERKCQFTSSSGRLTSDFERLDFGLGGSGSLGVYSDGRKDTYFDKHVYSIHTRKVRQVRPEHYYTKEYEDKVYCVTVPGGLIFTRYGEGNGFWNGNSVGVDLRVAFGTRIGDDKRMYAPFRNFKTGKIEYKNPRDLAEAVVAFPGASRSSNLVVPALKGGQLLHLRKDQVDYELPTMEQSFSPTTNMVPLKSANKAQRNSMGARFITQALPLVQREAPYVRNAVPGQDGVSFQELYGRHMGTAFADDKQPGVVESVTPDSIKVKYADGTSKEHHIYNNSPTGRKVRTHSMPMVKEGDVVNPGQILASSNYTDDKGHAAYGLNLRVAYAPFIKPKHGLSTYEDSIMIGESAAKKLTSDHMYTESHRHDETTIPGKAAYLSVFSGKHPLSMLRHYDDDGAVKVGQTVESGQPLVLSVRKRQDGYGVGRSSKAAIIDSSITWDHDEPGVVQDVVKTKDGIRVSVTTQKPLKDADKVSNAMGGKGVIQIVPDHLMPTTEDGEKLDAVYSSLGLVSRINPGALIEAALGKVAHKTGKPYIIKDFGDIENLTEFARREMLKHGVKDKENLIDPETGRVIPNVFVGMPYIMKLMHISEAKVKGRGRGSYDESGKPMRGQSGGAQRMSMGDTLGITAHSSGGVLNDVKNFRGQQNEEFWAAYMAGYPPTPPKVNKQYERFLEMLKGAGVYPLREGPRVQIMGLTQKQIDEMTKDRELQNAETVDLHKDNKPVKGGLFDEAIVGPADAGQWSKITLHEPHLNPVFEDPARRLLDLTEKDFRDVIAGRKDIHGRTGMAAIGYELNKIDVAKELDAQREILETGTKTAREVAARKLGYLKGAERTGVHPKDWMLDAVPVLPPSFRPVRTSGAGASVLVADVNGLYRDLFETNKIIKELSGRVGDLGDEKLALYDAFKAVTGLGEPVNKKNAERGLTGILEDVTGKGGSKTSIVQQKLLGSSADLSGRAVVIPNPDLDMDTIGVPEALAWDTFQPFIIRRLVRQGVPRLEAFRMVNDKDPKAKKAMIAEMDERIVTATRYPVLHKFGIMAFRPKLVAGTALQTSPLVNKPYGLDHDGDQMTLHVILSDKGKEDAENKMLPSKNLISPGDRKSPNFAPNMEFIAGLHQASTVDEQNEPIKFKTIEDAVKAYEDRKINMGTRVDIG